MKTKLFELLTRKYAVLAVFITSLLLFLIEDDLDFFFGLGVVLFIAWQKKWDWSFAGISRKISARTLMQSTGFAILFYLLSDTMNVFVEHYLGKVDLSFLAHLEGNTANYLITMVIMWIFAACGEEILYHGYYTKGLARLMGNTKLAWFLTIMIITAFFSAGHLNQGLSGAIGVGLSSLLFSWLFYRNQHNLWLLILVHGIYDSIGLTLIYTGKYELYSQWLTSLLYG